MFTYGHCMSLARNSRLVQLLDSCHVSAGIEWGQEPRIHDEQELVSGHEPLSNRKDVRVVVRARESSGLDVPADRAANTTNAVGHHGLSVAGAAKDDATFAFSPGDGDRQGANHVRVVDR